jgi:hypothetical protein
MQASALAMDFSQSFDKRRHRFSQAKVRSTIHRRGSTSKGIVKLRDISKAGTWAHHQTSAIRCRFWPSFSS